MEFSVLLRAAAVAALSLSSYLACADEIDSAPRDPSQSWFTTATLEKFTIDKKAAAKQKVGTDATALGFEGEYFFNSNWSTTIGMSFLFYDDKAGFSETVQNTSTKEIKTASSDASALPLYGDLGYKKFIRGEKSESYLTARLGMSVLLDSSREIANCTNCTEQDIDISGGVYATLGAGFKVGETWGMGIHYKNYFSGDITNVIGFSITWGY